MFTSRKETVYIASKALTDAQQGYVAIELDLLAVAWAVEKFHHFLYASHFILETVIHSRIDQPASRLLVSIRWSKTHYQAP